MQPPLDPDTFHSMAVSEEPRLRRLALTLARDESAADDLVQETFCRALRYREGYQPGECGIGPWLTTILRNAFTAAAAKQSRWPVVLKPDRAEAVPDAGNTTGINAVQDRGVGAPSSAGSVDALFNFHDVAEELDQRITRALADLDETYRRPLVMWALRGMSYPEIAERLGIPLGTVLSRLSRARGKLGPRLCELASERRMKTVKSSAVALA